MEARPEPMMSRETLHKMALPPSDSPVGDDDEPTAEERGWGSALLRRGWWLGKRVAVAGAIVTSSPVLIPPLLVFSTLGVALSFPFAIYLASFVGTKKVMGSLLPLSSPSSPSEVDNIVEEEEELVEGVLDMEPSVEPSSKGGNMNRAGDDDQVGIQGKARAGEAENIVAPDPWSSKMKEDGHSHVAKVLSQSIIETEHLVSEDATKERDMSESEPCEALETKGGIMKSSDVEVEEEEAPGKEIGEGEAGEMGKEEAEYMEKTGMPRPLDKETTGCVHLAAVPGEQKIEIKHLGLEDKRGERDKDGIGSRLDFEVELVNRAGAEAVGEEKPVRGLGIGGNGETGYLSEKSEGVNQVIKIEHLCLEEYRDKGSTDKLKEEKQPSSVSSEAHGGDRCNRGVGTVKDDELNYKVATGEKTEAEEVKKHQSSLRLEHVSLSYDDRNAVFLEKEVEVVEVVVSEDKEETKGEDDTDNRIEIKMPEAMEGGYERGRESKVEQNRRPVGSEMAQEERQVKEQKEVEDERKEEREGEEDPCELSSEYASVAEDRSSDIADTESRCSIEQVLDMRLATLTAMQGAMRSDEEGQHLEEKIWEQINAIRTIIGYKAVVHSSVVCELRAMYLFTGVEPPASFKDSADLAEVNDNLQYLKSVIGVK